MEAVTLSEQSQTTAGILLLAIATIAWGGLFVSRLVRGKEPATEFQLAFNRAGHGHAGILVTLALVTQLFIDASGLTGPIEFVARYGVAWSAILIPAGFFFSAAGEGRTSPNQLFALVYVGAAALVAGVVALGSGLLFL